MTNRAVSGIWVRKDGAFHPVVAAGTPGPGPQAPAPPTGLDFTATLSSITLTWTAAVPAEGDGIDHYVIYRSGAVVGTSNGVTFTQSGLPSASPDYPYSVVAVADSGRASEHSVTVVARTLAPQVATTRYGFTAVQRSGEGTTAAFDRISPLLGRPKNYRFYWSNTTLSWSALNSAMGTRLNNMDFVVVSNKMTPPNINTGQYDATITAFANAVTRPTILIAPPHEIDVKDPNGAGSTQFGTPAQYKAAVTRWTSLVRATGNPLIKTGIGMGFNQYPSRWAIWCPPTAADFDFFCFDPYRWDSTAGKSGTTYADGYGSMKRALDWIQGRYGWADASRIIVTETSHATGDPSTPGLPTDVQASNWLHGMWTCAEERKLYAVQYFYNDNGQLLSTASTNVPGDPTPPYPLARAQWFAHSGLTDPGGY